MNIKRDIEALLEVRVLTTLIVLIAIISPGFLPLFYFYRTLFLQLDFFETILISSMVGLFLGLILAVPALIRTLGEYRGEIDRHTKVLEGIKKIGTSLTDFNKEINAKSTPIKIRNEYKQTVECYKSIEGPLDKLLNDAQKSVYKRVVGNLYAEIAGNSLLVFVIVCINIAEQFLMKQNNFRLFIAQTAPYFLGMFTLNCLSAFMRKSRIKTLLILLVIIMVVAGRNWVGQNVWPY